MNNKNKGFTLVELLAVIIIMGIITVMAIPGLNYLKDKNTTTKFLQYKNFVVESGRLYTDSYSEDMFGFNGTGCYVINYNELKKKNLIKEFNDKSVSCDNPDTFVRVEKNGDKIKYIPSLKCVNKKGAVVYNNITTKCRNDYSKVPTIKIDIEYPNHYGEWSSEKKFIIHLHSDVGFIDNVSIQYGFNTNNKSIPSSMKRKDFHNNYGVEDLKLEFLESGNKNGKYYLYIDATEAVNSEGFSANTMWSVELSYDSIPPTKPVVTNKFLNRWYNKNDSSRENYVIQLYSTDNESGIREFRYRFPNRTSEWTSYYNSNHDHFTTTPFIVNRNEVVQFRACDNMGYCSDIAESKIMIDTIPPIVNHSISSKNAWTNSNVTVYTETSDNLSGFNNVYFGPSASNVNNHAWSNISGNKASVVWNYEYQGNVYVRAIDNAGNSSAGVYAGNVLIDRTKPNITSIYNNSNNNWTANNVTITAKANDNASGVAGYFYGYSSNNVSYTDIQVSGNNMRGVWSGPHNSQIFLKVKDKAGNVSDPISAGYVRIDRQKPSCSISTSAYPDGNGKYKKGTVFTLNVNDNGSIGSYGIGSYNYQNNITLNNVGNSTIIGYVKDKAGNSSSCYKDVVIKPDFYCDKGTLNGNICLTPILNKSGYELVGYWLCCKPGGKTCDSGTCQYFDNKWVEKYECPSGFRRYSGYGKNTICYKNALVG